MFVREEIEAREQTTLSPFAVKAAKSKGRAFEEEKCTYRTDFQRDKDRILHSKAFRRLKQKTQVFLTNQDDHYRTRLTHTLEVAQIARTIARALQLNEDLVEAIALGHDLGHTPFGHEGERVLQKCNPTGFAHNEQSVRVVEKLEKDYTRGLNLTFEVLDGILNHQTGSKPQTLEGWVVQYSDKIAYLNHDIEDAIDAKILSSNQIPIEVITVLGDNKSKRITTLIDSIVKNSDSTIQMAPEVFKQYNHLRKFLFLEVYSNEIVKSENEKVEKMLTFLYEYFCAHYDGLPVFYQTILKNEGKDRAVTDYISGMTDDFATQTFQNLFIPKSYMFFNK